MKPLNLKNLNAEVIAKVRGGRRNGESNQDGQITLDEV